MSTQVIDGIAVEIDGAGPVVLCIHGLGGSSNTWTPLMPALNGYQIVRIDLPGSGRSQHGSHLSISDMVDAIANVIQRLAIEKTILVGHSMGTIVCQHFATRFPDLVRALALFGPLVCPPDAARSAIKGRAEKAATGGIAAMQEIADAIVNGALSAETKASNFTAIAAVRESLMRQDASGYGKSCMALADSQSAEIENIRVPVLLVTGDQDGVAPVANVSAMVDRIEGSQMHVLKECGHWPTFEKPVECQRQLTEFLKSVV